MLATACASCGSTASQAGDSTGADQHSGPAAAADRPEVDYSGLADYDCERLDALLDEVIGPGDHQGIPHAENWTAGTDYKGGCVFGDAGVSIEIHLAEPNEHSFEWSIDAPDRAAEREEKSVDVGDEAYQDVSGEGVVLVARKDLVEVRLGAPISGGQSMDPVGMIGLARMILEPWPSGPGAQESLGEPDPPDVPLPPGVVRGDLEYFDVTEFNSKVEEAGGDLDGMKLDPEITPSTFSVNFPASPPQARAYCQELRAAGLETGLEDALANVVDAPNSEPSEEGSEESPCDLTDEDIMASVDKGIDGYVLTIMDWDDLVRQVRICQQSPERCDDE